MVARVLGEHKVASSNLVTPTDQGRYSKDLVLVKHDLTSQRLKSCVVPILISAEASEMPGLST
jgi:hypothetical protein